MIDETDRKILTLLQENARYSNAEIARRVGMAPSGIFERIKKLEKNGVVLGYQAVVNPAALGLSLLAFVWVDLSDMKDAPRTGGRLALVPGVQEVHHNAGAYCYLLKVRCASTDRLRDILLQINAIPEVRSTQTTIVLKPVKESCSLGIDQDRE